MAFDLVEIALDRFTDFSLFERIASEIMRIYGYSNITPLGGVFDEGQDAIDEKHYIGEGIQKTVFQYSLQEKVASKITDTLEKLKKKEIIYTKLIIVTNRIITTQQQLAFKKLAIKEYSKDIEFFDKNKLIPILADQSNNLMIRYFPNIKTQVDVYFSERKVDISESKEKSFLKTCSVFYYSSESEFVKKEFLDRLIVEILANSTKPIKDIPTLVSIINNRITAKTIDDIQTSNSIARLKASGAISVADEIKLSQIKKIELLNTESRIRENVNALISGIMNNIHSITKTKVSLEEDGFIRSNCLKTIVSCFRLYGYDIARQLTSKEGIKQIVDVNDNEIVSCASRNISDELCSLLLAEIAEMFFEPNEEQYSILGDMCRSYIASVILSIDPVLSDFQITKISKKVFILDTDFILDTIISDLPKKTKNKKTIDTLLAIGCRIVIPRSCIMECINHIKISNNTYLHFSETLLSLPPELVEQHVWNVFVKGYYYYNRNNSKSRISFNEYKNNYYEAENEYAFMLDVIKSKLSGKVEVVDQKDLIDEEIAEDEIKSLGDRIYDLMKDSRKAKYRTTEEMKQISYIDAELYLIALKLNSEVNDSRNGILSQNAYIISESNRYIRAVAGTDKYKNIIIRSYSIYSLLRLIGSAKGARDDFDTLADPLLTRIVTGMWDDVERLIKNGIRLDDMSITRLRWDFDTNLHSMLVKIDENDQNDDTKSVNETDDYMELVKLLKSKGYSLIPEAEQLIAVVTDSRNEIEKLRHEKDEAQAIIDKIMKKSEEFGKKKQRYLRRVLSRKKN